MCTDSKALDVQSINKACFPRAAGRFTYPDCAGRHVGLPMRSYTCLSFLDLQVATTRTTFVQKIWGKTASGTTYFQTIPKQGADFGFCRAAETKTPHLD
eukprot:365349-Chlamydomonas_euryale.AAC.5